VADGAQDDRIAQWAADVASLAPAGVYVCPWHEPDHQVDPSAGMSTDDYREMYWHAKDIFAKHNASNAVWAMDYSVQLVGPHGANVMPLWPGDDAVDWLFFNVFERSKQLQKFGEDYTNLTARIYDALVANSTNTSTVCVRGCNFVSKPWGLGAFGTHADISAPDRVAFLRDAAARMADFPRLSAYLYYDSKESAISSGAMQSAYEDLLRAGAFTANDAGAPPRLVEE
jgi:hypothetical protein